MNDDQTPESIRAVAVRPALAAVRARRSHSKVTDDAPSHAELERLIGAMHTVADHSGLRPWRIIELRGDARAKLGEALAKAASNASTDEKETKAGKRTAREKYVAKAERAPLVLAVVVSPVKDKIPVWEQEAVASGVAHTLGLLLHEAGWGSIWRTGSLTRTKSVRKAHKLGKREYLLGWLYVGGIPDRDRKPKRRKPINLARHLTTLDE